MNKKLKDFAKDNGLKDLTITSYENNIIALKITYQCGAFSLYEFDIQKQIFVWKWQDEDNYKLREDDCLSQFTVRNKDRIIRLINDVS